MLRMELLLETLQVLAAAFGGIASMWIVHHLAATAAAAARASREGDAPLQAPLRTHRR